MAFDQSRAVLVGTWAYRDPDLTDVPAAKHSLAGMTELLTGPRCGWPATRTTVFANPDRPGDLPDRLTALFEDVTDVALFYYVGHGKLDDSEELCLGLAGTLSKPGRLATTSLQYGAVRRALLNSPARVKIVILDCCYAGMAIAAGGGRLGNDDLVDRARVAGTYVIAASGAYQQAWCETAAPDATPLTYFTKQFVNVVKDGIPGQGSHLRLNAIFAAVRDRLEEHRQPTPTKKSTDWADDFVFADNTTGPVVGSHAAVSASSTRPGHGTLQVPATAQRQSARATRPVLSSPVGRRDQTWRSRIIVGGAGLLLSGTTGIVLAAVDGEDGGTAGPTPAGSAARTTTIADPRSAGEVLDSYLRDRLVDRDDAAAKAMQCRTPNLTLMDSYVADIKNREKQFNVTIGSSWTGLRSTAASTDKATEEVDLIKTVAPGIERATETWTFDLNNENGWRVCSGQKIS